MTEEQQQVLAVEEQALLSSHSSAMLSGHSSRVDAKPIETTEMTHIEEDMVFNVSSSPPKLPEIVQSI